MIGILLICIILFANLLVLAMAVVRYQKRSSIRYPTPEADRLRGDLAA
jgi:hypothetical protein